MEELEAKLKELEQDQTQQEREIVSLTNKNKHLEEELEFAQDKIKEYKDNETEGNDYKRDLEDALRRISLLQTELEDSDKSLKETTTK